MQAPLTPLEFAARARRLYARREAVLDGTRRLTYAQFFDRCDRWAAVLRQLCDSGQSFEAVADLCEMSARKDPALQRLAAVLPAD